ncbi:hypothetical protein ACE1AT_03345 [Pelatocladus sp. BLCC-F211]
MIKLQRLKVVLVVYRCKHSNSANISGMGFLWFLSYGSGKQ